MNAHARIQRGRRPVTVVVAALSMAVSGVVIANAATPPPAHQNNTVGLKQVGPIDETNGFPLWYKDTNNVRLELCLDPSDANCIMGDLPDPTKPVSFPDNFPDEAFWSVADSSIDAGGGNDALLVTATEAAFAADVADGQQISFGRVRVRVGGLVDGADYKVTHPFGVDSFTSEAGAVKGINNTEDIGSLNPDGVFDQTLGSRPGPFLKWPTGAPAGYLGDPTVEHVVTGSPYNQNYFRVEGPAGSFTGSTQLCANAALGNSPTATDDCIESNLFTVQGKIATRAGVQVSKAYYANSGTGHMMDIFASSEPGQDMIISGTGVSQTKMRDDGKGHYYARVFADGAPPSDLAVTNKTDAPNTADHIEQSLFGDKVHINNAIYDNGTRSLKVNAQSGDESAALKLDGYPNAVPTIDANHVQTWTVPNVVVPPADVVVTSGKGGVASEDVVITGSEDPSAQVVATIAADTNAVQVGQAVTLDANSSVGTISSFGWAVSPTTGATLTGTGAARTFTGTAPGTYTVTLTATGSGAGNTDTDTFTITVSDPGAPPVADAGPDQPGVIPTSTVTLDGTGSKFASSFSWLQTGGPAVTLNNAPTANPTFVVPPGSASVSYTFTLTIKDVNGTASTDTVVVTTDPGSVTVDDAQYKRGGLEWRVRGTAKFCSANNLVSVYWNKPGASPVLLGTTTPTAALGVCSFDFRLKNTPTALQPAAAGTVTIRSALGGELLNRAFAFQ